MSTKSLESLLLDLPPTLRAEVQDFVEFLLIKHRPPSRRSLGQDWANCVHADSPTTTAVDLQHRANAWRTE